MSILYIVATPIGNLEDITLRALRILKEVDLILCEDTRVTQKLLAHYQIKTPTLSYHQHSKISKIDLIIEKLKKGKNLAQVTDAGTPGISDPGGKLISQIVKELGDKVKIVAIPGPAAVTTLASVAGIDLGRFVFLGYPPHKKGREKFFREVISSKYPVIYYDSPYRLIKNLELLSVFASEAKQSWYKCEIAVSPRTSTAPDNDIYVVLGRELTKMFEEIKRGKIFEILEYYKNNKEKIKGEFVLIINKEKAEITRLSKD